MVYIPKNVKQGDGSYFQWYNCVLASAATAIDRHTLGRVTSTGAKMRSCQDDKSGGTDLEHARTAWSRCYGQSLAVYDNISWTTFKASVNSGRGAILCGHYGSLPPPYTWQDSFNGNHAVYVNHITSSGLFYVGDPLGGYKQIPEYYMKNFAGYLRTASGGVFGFGRAYAAFTRITTTSVPAPTGVVLHYSGVRIVANTFAARVASKQRRSPYIRSDNVIQIVPAATKFLAYQKTTAGTSVLGSSLWYGNKYGNMWMHSSTLRDI